MFTATQFVVITCVLLIMTVEGSLRSRNHHYIYTYGGAHKFRFTARTYLSRNQRVQLKTNGGIHQFDFKRDGNPTDKEVELLKAECLSLDIDPALGVTEDDVVTAFRKYDADGNGALLNAELGNFTNAFEIIEACETVNNIV